MGQTVWRWRRSAATAAIIVACLLIAGGLSCPAVAYTAVGDRLFPATLQLPQIAPGDEFYINGQTLPRAGRAGTPNHASNFTGTYVKSITDRLGIVLDEAYTRLDQSGGGASYGWQNLDTELKYRAFDSQPHEFLVSLGVDREFGDTGARGVGAFKSGATTPRVYFGKGLGDLDIGYGRALAVAGFAGYQFADTKPRPDLAVGGLVVEYSIPYLQSKIAALDLPPLVRGLTPMTEFQFSTPSGQSFGARTTALIAPGLSYAGEGWELAVEGLVPLSRATGRGIGVTAQFHLSLDFVAAETIGHPLFFNP
ncbi:MAG TPA: hypothetical protein VHY35_05840 [Stellaceae bacterium]|jgi:hypothetical protein|nr:hypothetical protein [Stellaceae bacterium]